jgi:alanine racemase
MIRKQVKRLIQIAAANNYQTLNTMRVHQAGILSNVSLLQHKHPDMGIIPVLKANAYGHGLQEVARILNQTTCAFVAVDGYFEAARIRDISRHPILVLGYIKPENTHMLDLKKCSFVVQDIAGLEALAGRGKPVRVHMELNTGMNRLGLSGSDLDEYLDALKRFPTLTLEGVMTHLADADNEADNSFTAKQIKAFDALVARIQARGFQPRYIHAAQTAGSTKAASSYANAIRLGIGMYGINPLGPKDRHYHDFDELMPAMELTSTIIKVIDLQPGDKVSYNGIFTAPRRMKIGVLPIGYYEGVPRELSNTGVMTYQSQPLPIVGRVCMNHTMVDLSGVHATVGDRVTVISADPAHPNSIARLCRDHSLFSYELLARMSGSIRRVCV